MENGLISVKELKVVGESRGLPWKFLDTLPSECSSCSGELAINSTLTELSCTNVFCTSKVVMRMRAMCEALSIKGLGEERLRSMVIEGGITNPLELFNVVEGSSLPGLSYNVSSDIIPQILRNNEFSLAEYLAVAQLPYIQTVSSRLVQGYFSLEEFLSDVESGGVAFIQDRLGIAKQIDDYGNEVVSIQAYKIFRSLMEYSESLLQGLQWVTIIDNSQKREIALVISDGVGSGYKTKKDFINYIKERYKEHAYLTIGTSVTKKTTDFVWHGFESGSNAGHTTKVKTFLKYQDMGVPIDGLTGKQFIEKYDKIFGIF